MKFIFNILIAVAIKLAYFVILTGYFLYHKHYSENDSRLPQTAGATENTHKVRKPSTEQYYGYPRFNASHPSYF